MSNCDAQEANQKIDELLAQLGHELRNPLAAICSALAVLGREGEDPATRAWVQGVLERQTHHMGCLIDRLLDFACIRNGKVQIQKQRIELEQVVNLAVEAVRPCIEERRHILDITLPPGPVTLLADPIRLVEVLTNLLANAAKYTDPGGRIGLTALPEGDDIAIRVRDNGVGIAPEMLPHVFDLYRQSSRTTDHSAGGMGLGLALVRQLVEMHGGVVSVISAGPGQGSEFVVCLPRFPSIEDLHGNRQAR